MVAHGESHGHEGVPACGGGDEAAEGLFGLVEQGLLQEEVAAGVAGEAELRGDDDFGSGVSGAPDGLAKGLFVEGNVGDPHLGNHCRYSCKSVSIHNYPTKLVKISDMGLTWRERG